MKRLKKTIRRIIRSIKNKPTDSITIGVDIKNCEDCDYKNPISYGGRLKYYPVKNDDVFLKLSPTCIPGEYTAIMLLDIIRRYCNHNKKLIKVDTDNNGDYTSMEFIKR